VSIQDSPDVSDIDRVHQLAATGQLADILTRIAGTRDKEKL
jgi:hypothetical protein